MMKIQTNDELKGRTALAARGAVAVTRDVTAHIEQQRANACRDNPR
jgi:hypothetical protein